MPIEGSLILRIRLQTLKQNLARVRQVRNTLGILYTDAKSLVNKLQDSERGIVATAGSLRRGLGSAKNELDGTYSDLSSARQAIERAKRALEPSYELSKDIESSLAVLLTELISPVQKLENLHTDQFETRLSRELISNAGQFIEQLENIESNLNANGNSETDHRGAWKLYTEILSQKNEPAMGGVLEGYVGLLSGIALRHFGADEGICEIADKLIGLCHLPLSSPIIPAYEESVLSDSIRLGLSPGWSIWVLPLAAREFAKASVLPTESTAGPFVQRESATSGIAADDLTDYLAEAFATYTMGFAYAYPAFLLRFEPWESDKSQANHAPDNRRAEVVLGMLRIADNKSSNINEAAINQLQKEWTAALTQFHPEGPPVIPADELATLKSLVTKMHRWLENNFLPKYNNSNFHRVGKSLAMHVQNHGARVMDSDDVDGNGWDVTNPWDVMNAAWQVRVMHEFDPDDIVAQARQMWLQIETSTKEARSSGGMPRGPRPGSYR